MGNKVVVAFIFDLDKVPTDEVENLDPQMTAKDIKAIMTEDMEDWEREVIEVRVWKKGVPHLLPFLPRSEG